MAEADPFVWAGPVDPAGWIDLLTSVETGLLLDTGELSGLPSLEGMTATSMAGSPSLTGPVTPAAPLSVEH